MDASRGVSEGSAAAVVDVRSGSLPAGPELAAVLASVDRSAVAAQDLPELVRARARLLAFEQAEFLLDLVEAVHGAAAEPGSTQRYVSRELEDDAAVELGWALHWSESWTAAQIDLAEALVGRLPMVFDALRAGRIDRERAFAFVDSLRFVDEEVARSIAARLVERAQRRRYRKAASDRSRPTSPAWSPSIRGPTRPGDGPCTATTASCCITATLTSDPPQ